jgi:hypothetical protein
MDISSCNVSPMIYRYSNVVQMSNALGPYRPDYYQLLIERSRGSSEHIAPLCSCSWRGSLILRVSLVRFKGAVGRP